MRERLIIAAVLGVACSGPASGDVIEYYQGDISGWLASAGPSHHVTFAELGESVLITDQYTDHGFTVDPSWGFFTFETPLAEDGWVGFSFETDLVLDMTNEQTAFAVESLNGLAIKFYNDGVEVGSETITPGFFTGLVLDEPFDQVALLGGVTLDDVYIPVIPGPAAGMLVLVAGLLGGSRRRVGG